MVAGNLNGAKPVVSGEPHVSQAGPRGVYCPHQVQATFTFVDFILASLPMGKASIVPFGGSPRQSAYPTSGLSAPFRRSGGRIGSRPKACRLCTKWRGPEAIAFAC